MVSVKEVEIFPVCSEADDNSADDNMSPAS